MSRRLVLAITGASGAIYGVRTLRFVERHYDAIYLCVSAHGRQVLEAELGIPSWPEEAFVQALIGKETHHVHLLDPMDYFTPPASGSAHHEGMVIIPCSMGTAGRIASGVSNDLITRAADVCLKERRKLILVVRETPLNLVHLRNLTSLAEAGALILPACPAFYGQPTTIEALVDTVVHRVARHLGIPAEDGSEWQIPAAER